MNIGERLRDLRESKHLSQADIEKRTGLLRHYVSRVENGHTVPVIETLEKMVRAMELPLYQLFYDGEQPTKATELPDRNDGDDSAWGAFGKDARTLNRFRNFLSQMTVDDRKLLLFVAQKMARGSRDVTGVFGTK